MIDFIRGRLVKKDLARAVVETGGIGYLLEVPYSTVRTLEEGKEVTILTHLHVRETEMRLYGFATEAERRLFQLLLTVNKIGPALAMSILSAFSVEEFQRTVRQGDPKALAARVKGMGPKTAQRLLIELKPTTEELVVPANQAETDTRRKAADVVKALVQLE